MTSSTEKLTNELSGVSRAIYNTLAAHPEWKREDGKVICTGPECDWEKPSGGSVKKRWRNHQTWELKWSVEQWYFGEDEE